MTNKVKNVLFLCTGNSARSVLGEGILNHIGQGKFKAYSAGSKPLGKANPFAIKQLKSQGIQGVFTSQSWDDFNHKNAPIIDIVITVCDNAAKEVCPQFKGAPEKLHWGLIDPTAVEGADANKQLAFQKTYNEIKQRIEQDILK